MKEPHFAGIREDARRMAEADAPEVRPSASPPFSLEGREIFEFLLDRSRDIILVLDKSARILYANRRTLDAFGYAGEKVIGRSVTAFLTKDSARKAVAALAQEFLGRPHPEITLEAKTKSGETRYLRVAEGSAPIREDGRVAGMLISATDTTEQRRAEIEARDSENRFRDLWENAPVAYHIADLEGTITDANQTEARMFGYRKEELIGRPIFDLIPAEQRANAQSRFLDKVAGRQLARSADRIFIRKNGSRIHVVVDDSLERDSAGKVTGIRSTLVDITKLRESQEALRKSELHFRDLVEKSGIAIYADDRDGHLKYFNERYMEIIGYTAEEMSKLAPWSTIHPDDVERVRAYHLGRLEGRGVPSRYEFRVIRKNGSVIVLEADVTVVEEEGRPVGTRSFLWDITDRRRAEEERRESNERFRSVVEHSHDGIFLIDDAFLVLYANAEAAHTLGRPLEEIIGQDFRQLLDDGSRELVTSMYQRRQNGETVPSRYEFDAVRGDGEKKRVEISSSIVANAAGRKETIAQFRDITERMRAEEELRLNEARLQHIVEIIQYSGASTQEFLDFALDKAIALTRSKIGYIFFYHEDRKQFVLNSWSRDVMKECAVANQKSVYNLDKTGLWGEAVRQREPIVINDFETPDPLRKGCPEGHSKLLKYMTMPVFSGTQIVAVVGLANKEKDYTRTDVLQCTLLMDAVWKVVERRQAEEARRRIEWMLSPGHGTHASSETAPEKPATPVLPDLTALNTSRVILGTIGPEMLRNIVSDHLDLLDTSSIVFEANGDYAFLVTSSAWCRFMRQASRRLCGTEDDREALDGGKWLCHESCWTGGAKVAVRTGQPADVACAGGIRCYAVPIRAGDRIIGAVKFGYGDPPLDRVRLEKLAAAYGVTVEELAERAAAYESRPPYIIEMAKRRLEASARIIAEIFEHAQADAELEKTLEDLRKIIGATVQAIATAV